VRCNQLPGTRRLPLIARVHAVQLALAVGQPCLLPAYLLQPSSCHLNRRTGPI
jgi:hypothetical protein